MKNRLFDTTALTVVLESAHWNLVGTEAPGEVYALQDNSHSAWMAKHTESHPAREILVVLKGDSRYGFKGQVYACHPGTVIFIDSYEPHDSYYPRSAGPLLHLWLRLFERDVVANLLNIQRGVARNAGLFLALTDDPAATLLATTWDKLKATPDLPPPFRRATICAALSSVLLRVIEQGYAAALGHHPAETFQSQIIETIRRHVEQTSGRGVPLNEAARLAGYSKFHFLRLFKHELGMNFHDYVDECRRKKVTAMLREKKTKTDISNTLGFSHPSSLLRWMKSQNINKG